ncbi:MAG: tetratricopeptide repeat protein [Chloroflexi bacterium]|nr:tetratricopeptide repeat protein [Chloroflexota bacterium]
MVAQLEWARTSRRPYADTTNQFGIRSKQIEWLTRLDVEHDNLRAALAWAISENATRAAKALRLTAALWMYWDTRGYFHEGIQWCERALAASEAENSARVQTIIGAGMVARLGDMERTIVLGEQALALARRIQDRRGAAEALFGLGVICFYTGDTARADALLDEALQLWNALGDPWDIAHAQGPFAQRALLKGDYARAAELYGKSLTLFRQVGDLREVAGALGNLTGVVKTQGDLTRAHALAQEGLDLYSALADKHGIATAQCALGQIARAQGQWQTAHTCLDASIALFEEMGDKGCRLESALEFAALLQDEHQSAKAAEFAARIVQDAETLGWMPGIPCAKNILARAALAQDDVEGAQLHSTQAMQHAGALLEPIAAIGLIETAALLANARRLFVTATKLFRAAQTERAQIGAPLSPVERGQYDRVLDALRAQLGADDFERAWAEGRALTMSQARGLALAMASK